MRQDWRFIILTLLGSALPLGTVSAQLAGSYTIGAAGDFATITAAVDSLTTAGTSAPVTFNIEPGTYVEQVTLTSFSRTGNADDEVVFQPESGAVVWQYPASSLVDNWIVKLVSVSYISFVDIQFEATDPTETFGRIVVIDVNGSHLSFMGCVFTGHPVPGSSDGTLVYVDQLNPPASDHVVNFFDNQFTLGYRGVTFSSSANANATLYGNSFDNQFDGAMSFSGGTHAVIDSNFVDDAGFSSVAYIGIRSVGHFIITRNTLRIVKSIGIEVASSFTPVTRLIANNMVSMTGVGADYGIRVESDSTEIYHNSVRTAQAGSSGIPLSIADAVGADVKNNILVHYDGGVAMEAETATSVAESDYNILHSTGGDFVTYDGSDYSNLQSYRFDSGLDFFSTTTNVSFVDTVGTHDLHLTAPSDDNISLVAPRLDAVSTDLDGEMRAPFTTYRGADEGVEYEPLNNDSTTAGFYTVGGVSPDFADPSDAIKHLNLRGISGDVTFRVRAGTYFVHQYIKYANYGTGPSSAAKTTADEQVTIRSSTLANPAEFRFAATSAENNWILRLLSADNIRIRNIDFLANGTPPFGRAIVLDGDVDGLEMDRNHLTGLAGETLDEAALVFGVDDDQDDAVLFLNRFTGGSYGIYLDTGGSSNQGANAQFTRNYLDDQAAGGIRTNQDDVLIRQDTVVSSRPGVTGVEVSLAIRPSIERNAIHLTGAGSVGLALDRSGGDPFDDGLVTNNFVSVDGTAVEFQGTSGRFGVYHNTLRADTVAVGIPSTSIGENTLLNNILVNTATGEALRVDEAADVTSSNYNDLFNQSGTLVHWDGVDYASLATYQAGSGEDANSVSKSVVFADAPGNDLHLAGASDGDADLIGTPLAQVTNDIDDDPRSGTQPYMGADEASPFTIGVTLFAFLEGPFGGGSMASILNSSGALASDALSHPYGVAPWDYPGSESVSAGFFTTHPTVVDWVYLKIYSGSPPAVVAVDSTVGLVLADGAIVSHADTTQPVSFDVTPGLYHAAVFHRNHLGVISSSSIDLTAVMPSYDFTAGGSAYTAGPPALKDLSGGDWGLFAADDNADGQVTATDFNSWLTDTKSAATGYLSSDFNMDGQVTANDFNVWLTNTKAAASSQVP